MEVERGLSGDVGSGSLWKRHRVKLIVSVVLGGGIAWAMSRGGLPILPSATQLASVELWTIPAYLGIMACVHFLRAVRWRHLLRPLGEVSLSSVISVSWISFAIILLSPLRSGEVARPYLITKKSSIRWWEATGTIGAERVIDGVTLSVLLFVALSLSTPLSPLPDRVGDLPVPVAAVPGAAYTALVVFGGAFATMAVFYFARDFARRVTKAVLGVVSERAAVFVADAVERIAHGLSFLPSGRHVVPFLAETALYWGLNGLGIWFLAWGCGLTGAELTHAFVTMGCIGIGILVPAGPGFFGAFQFSAFMALAMYFPEGLLLGPGGAFVFCLYACQVGWHLVAALLGLAIAPPDAPPAPSGNLATTTAES